jgi:hypothetical protein
LNFLSQKVTNFCSKKKTTEKNIFFTKTNLEKTFFIKNKLENIFLEKYFGNIFFLVFTRRAIIKKGEGLSRGGQLSVNLGYFGFWQIE